MVVYALDTQLVPTVAEAMGKRREIPGDQNPPDEQRKPLAAYRADVDRVLSMLEALAVDPRKDWKRIGISRMTGYRMLDYDIGQPTLRKVEAWAIEEQTKRPAPSGPSAAPVEEVTEVPDEWLALGSELHRLDPVGFADALDAVRDFVESRKLALRFLNKLLTAAQRPVSARR